MVGHAHTFFMFVNFFRAKLAVHIFHSEPIAAHAVRTCYKKSAFMKYRRADHRRASFARGTPKEFAIAGVDARHAAASELKVLFDAANIADNE